MLVKTLIALRLSGERIPAGRGIDLPEDAALQLEKEGSVELLEGKTADALEAVLTVEKVAADINVPAGTASTADGQINQEKNEGSPGPEAVEKVRSALNSQYESRDELAEKAKEVGIDFAWNAGKDKIIERALEQGKAELLLK